MELYHSLYTIKGLSNKNKKINPNNFYYYSPPRFHKIEPIMPQEYNDKIDKKHLTSMSYIEGKPMLNILEDVASANKFNIL